jgi:hypothetical protein
MGHRRSAAAVRKLQKGDATDQKQAEERSAEPLDCDVNLKVFVEAAQFLRVMVWT